MDRRRLVFRLAGLSWLLLALLSLWLYQREHFYSMLMFPVLEPLTLVFAGLIGLRRSRWAARFAVPVGLVLVWWLPTWASLAAQGCTDGSCGDQRLLFLVAPVATTTLSLVAGLWKVAGVTSMPSSAEPAEDEPAEDEPAVAR